MCCATMHDTRCKDGSTWHMWWQLQSDIAAHVLLHPEVRYNYFSPIFLHFTTCNKCLLFHPEVRYSYFSPIFYTLPHTTNASYFILKYATATSAPFFTLYHIQQMPPISSWSTLQLLQPHFLHLTTYNKCLLFHPEVRYSYFSPIFYTLPYTNKCLLFHPEACYSYFSPIFYTLPHTTNASYSILKYATATSAPFFPPYHIQRMPPIPSWSTLQLLQPHFLHFTTYNECLLFHPEVRYSYFSPIFYTLPHTTNASYFILKYATATSAPFFTLYHIQRMPPISSWSTLQLLQPHFLHFTTYNECLLFHPEVRYSYFSPIFYTLPYTTNASYFILKYATTTSAPLFYTLPYTTIASFHSILNQLCPCYTIHK